ncbi:MAG: efflux RND transporter permease subunit, partial [Robiginitomaculum sp.]
MTIGIMLFAVIGGIFAILNFPLDAEPDIPIPFINVTVVLPGVSPEDSQRLLIRPLETELKSVEGLKHMNGTAATSVGNVTLEFNASFDQDKAIQDVLEKVDRARSEFPQEAREPIVQEINTNKLPVVVINLFGNAPDRELQRLSKDLKRRIESIPQVLEANISGERVDVLEAIIDPALTESLGVSFEEIARAVASNNKLITAGALETDTGKFSVKLPGLIEDESDLADLVIRANPNGSIIRMRDIAHVARGYKDALSYARFDGNKSVSVEVSNRSGENMIETIDKVRAVVADMTGSVSWPDTVQVEFSQDRSNDTRVMVSTLFSSIINAVILVFIVCVAALGFRSALFVGWAIPASFLMALFLMFVQGESINFMILFGLILSVGVLVDSAIVIIEYADRKLAEGMPRKQAFKIAGERMFWPITSSTATTLAAFLPLLFWDDITGKFMSYLPLTMIYVLSASLLMALVFLPTMGALMGPRYVSKPTGNLKALSGAEGDPSDLRGITGLYARIITFLVSKPFLVIIGTVIMLVMIAGNFGKVMKGDEAAGILPKPVEFFTNTPSDQVFIVARTRGNSTPLSALEISKEIERRIKDIDGVKVVYSVSGAAASRGQVTGAQVPTDTVVKVFPELLPHAGRRKTLEIMEDMREAIKDMPGILTEVTAESQGPPLGK